MPPKNMHDDMVSRHEALKREESTSARAAHMASVKETQAIDAKLTEIFSKGSSVISQYSQDLTRRHKTTRCVKHDVIVLIVIALFLL